jgi:2-oxoglutarate ferredoxin oxidoreductase subunit gamma
MQPLTEIRIAGFGGQGVILAAAVIGRTDVLVVMSQEAFTRFAPQLKPDGVLIAEQDLVHIDTLPAGSRLYGVPATRLAEELRRKMVLNIVMVGFFGAVTNLCDPDALRQAVAASVPAPMETLNLRAFDRGFDYGAQLVARLAESENFVVS